MKRIKVTTEQINIKKYTLRDLINHYPNKINNLRKKEQEILYPLLDESLDMNSPPKEITKKILNKFIWGKNYNNPKTDHYHSNKLNIWKSLLLYAFNHHPFNSYVSFQNNIITIPEYNKSIFLLFLFLVSGIIG